MTSPSSSDQSMVGGMLVNTKGTGKAIYYAMSGTDENGVIEVVDSSLGADSERWDPVQPIPYNINGVPTWIVSVISEEGVFQKVALVKMDSDTVRVVEDNLVRALTKYRTLLAQRGNEMAPTSGMKLSKFGPAKVQRAFSKVLGGDENFYILLEGFPGRFFASFGETIDTLLIAAAKEGDVAKVHYLDTGEMVVQIDRIEIDGLVGQRSETQESFDTKREATRQAVKEVTETRDAENAFDSLTPEEQRELMEKQRAN